MIHVITSMSNLMPSTILFAEAFIILGLCDPFVFG